ncbi:MAG: hypothetical protein FJZ07_01055 [Candidatus Nealsonbacteria bacterium]|nr:hypothetical protein [Candidatus Nealsonbacteria bacterium]
MRNEEKISKKVIKLVEKLPYFSIGNLKLAGVGSEYLRILAVRMVKRGDFIRIKKGFYTTKFFVDKMRSENRYSEFLESLAIETYSPSYLSLDYVLYQNNLLTELPVNFTLVSKSKTASFNNPLGNFIYHKIKDTLFLGFKVEKKGEFLIYRATVAKALFDFLYFRKDLLINKETIKELRLNLGEMLPEDKKEFKTYIDLEGSIKMKEIYDKLGID